MWHDKMMAGEPLVSGRCKAPKGKTKISERRTRKEAFILLGLLILISF